MTQTDSPEKRAPKFRRRAEARPDEVLDAALALFSTKGFNATTVEQVGRAAGLSKAAVYLYFPSKRALLAGLVKRAVAPVAEIALQGVAGAKGDPRVMIAALLRMVALRLSAPEAVAVPALLLREAPGAPEIAQVYREEVLDRVLPALRGLIARGVAEGYLRPVDPDLTIRSIAGPVLAHILLKQVFGVEPDGGYDLGRLVENHLLILLAGLGPERSLS